jgi:hypothetical protein
MQEVKISHWKPHTEAYPETPNLNDIMLVKYGDIVNCFQELYGQWGIIEGNQWYNIGYLDGTLKEYEWLLISANE